MPCVELRCRQLCHRLAGRAEDAARSLARDREADAQGLIDPHCRSSLIEVVPASGSAGRAGTLVTAFALIWKYDSREANGQDVTYRWTGEGSLMVADSVVRADLARALLVAADGIERAMASGLRGTGLGVAHYLVLDHLRECEVATTSELGRIALVPPATLTRTIDKLVDLALVHRVLDEEDRRRIVVRLTDRGRGRPLPMPTWWTRRSRGRCPTCASGRRRLTEMLRGCRSGKRSGPAVLDY